MTKLNYIVERVDGTKLYTPNYKEATNGGNRIVGRYYTEIDERTEEQKAKNKEHARKAREYFLKKKRA